MNLRSWLRENFDDLELLRISTDQYAPGTIIDKDDFEVHITAREALGNPDGVNFSTVLKPALLIAKDFQQKITRGVSLGVLNLALIRLSESREVTATVEAQDVVQHRFDDLSRVRLRALLRRVRESDREMFRQIDEKLVIIETFAARKLTITFQSGASVIAGVTARQMLEPLESVDVSVSSSDGEKLEVVSDGTLPFGFRAFKL